MTEKIDLWASLRTAINGLANADAGNDERAKSALKRPRAAETLETTRTTRSEEGPESATGSPKAAETLATTRTTRSTREKNTTPKSDSSHVDFSDFEYENDDDGVARNSLCFSRVERVVRVVSSIPAGFSLPVADLSDPAPRVERVVSSIPAGFPPIEPSEKPLLLADGRRLHRFWAACIPSSASDAANDLCGFARAFGVVLVGDGLTLIVVEPWHSELPRKVLDQLAANAGEVIALLRGESTRPRLTYLPKADQ